MNKKLEARIDRLEKLISRRTVKNEAGGLDVASEAYAVAEEVNDAFKAVVNFRNKLVNANKVSGEFDDLIDDVNEMFGDLQLADQLSLKIARLLYKRYM